MPRDGDRGPNGTEHASRRGLGREASGHEAYLRAGMGKQGLEEGIGTERALVKRWFMCIPRGENRGRKGRGVPRGGDGGKGGLGI